MKDVPVSGRVHKNWNQWFARAKNKYDEQHPGRHTRAVRLLMDVRVFLCMDMRMAVCTAITVRMPVRMRFIQICTAKPPDSIDQSECDQYPTGNISTDGFERLQMCDGNSKTDPYESEDNRTAHVPNTAEDGDECRLKRGPFARFGHNDKRHIMIRAKYRMNERNRYRSYD